MKKAKVIVKFRKIIASYGDGRVSTADCRYTMKISKEKIIKWLLKNKYRFSVGINDNNLIDNVNYIEVFSEHFFDKNHYNRVNLITDFLLDNSIKNHYVGVIE